MPTLEGGHALAVGPLGLSLARLFAGDDGAADVLRHVRGVAVGTYAVGESTGGLALTEARARIEETGSIILGTSPSEFAQQIKAEYEVYAKVVQERQIRPE